MSPFENSRELFFLDINLNIIRFESRLCGIDYMEN